MNGKEKDIPFSATDNVSIFRVMRQKIRIILIVCFAIVRCMRWAINVEEISDLRNEESKTAANVRCLINERILDILHQNFRKLWK